MKLLGMIVGCFLATTVQADFMSILINGAIQISAIRNNRPIPTSLGAAFRAGGDTAMEKYYANELSNTVAMLSIVAQSANGGMGKDMGYAESGLDAWLPCGADLYATRDGIVTLTLGDTCPPKDKTESGFTVSPTNVMHHIKASFGERIHCKENICQIDFIGKK
ncbi:MAG: hypothetical protein SPL08_01685 [Pseudomonadota bacterium]|nr:hypothetical protein [Pseudomonadota bacterium]